MIKKTVKSDLSDKTYYALMAILAVCSAISVFLPQGNLVPQGKLPASKPILALATAAIMIVLYGGLGFLGLKLSRKLEFADIINREVSNKQRFLVPLIIGALLGVFFILCDIIFATYNGIGRMIHPPFPTSIFASISAGIGEEIIFRLFFISFFTWLFSFVIFKRKPKNAIFWAVAVFSALAFSLGHIPSLMVMFGLKQVTQIPAIFLGEIILLNGSVSMIAAYYFRKYGFLAPVGIHLWTDIVWHVIYGAA